MFARMDIPILILSIVQDRERGFRLGIDRYLTKPIGECAVSGVQVKISSARTVEV